MVCLTPSPCKKACHDLAKWLSHYLYFFSLLFFSGLTIQGWSARKYHMTKHHRVTGHSQVMSHDQVTWEHGKIVHRPYSSCISSVRNLIGTPSSSSCQLG